jgi:nucleotide-binding universal stress UspA family protein
MTYELLITTNGYKETWQSIEFGAWLAKSLRMKITLLGVTEELNPAAIDDQHPLEDIFERAVGLFNEADVEYSFEVQNGEAESLIPQKANSGNYITVVSPLGRPQLKRWLTGRSIRPLMERIEGPILYVPLTRVPIKKMLMSVGGLGYEVSAENLAFKLASAVQAEVVILHVVAPADITMPSTHDVRQNLNNLAETDTLPGRNLRKGLDLAQQLGVNARVITRQGHIVEQILAEIKEGDYDIVCMGSAFSAYSLRQIYTPNVTADVAEAAHLPVLTARYRPL